VQWKGVLVICCGKAGKRMGILGVGVREVKTLTVKVVTVTVIGNWKYSLAVRRVLSV
jgi:hypothetical protein